jgi:DNA uptake protein ComE-like DNA-binding protein
MNNRKSHFSLNRQERRGIFFLLLCIFLLQAYYFISISGGNNNPEPKFLPDTSLMARNQTQKSEKTPKDKGEQLAFNPNYLSDFKGYLLGLSVSELDRLHKYRAGNKFVNSAAEFQQVTGISDSMLQGLAPLFRFPEWVEKQWDNQKPVVSQHEEKQGREIRDLNMATAEELRKIRGIGPVLSVRIIRFRSALGGFLTDEQLEDVYGLDPEVAGRVLAQFKVVQPPGITKTNLNTASAKQLADNAYITFSLAREIIRYRKQVGRIGSFDEISHLKGFPADKIDRIKLYLTL